MPIAGKRSPMRMAMMVMTVKSSMRVNARRRLLRGREFIGNSFRGKLLR
jgi:hypothetical protein